MTAALEPRSGAGFPEGKDEEGVLQVKFGPAYRLGAAGQVERTGLLEADAGGELEHGLHFGFGEYFEGSAVFAESVGMDGGGEVIGGGDEVTSGFEDSEHFTEVGCKGNAVLDDTHARDKVEEAVIEAELGDVAREVMDGASAGGGLEGEVDAVKAVESEQEEGRKDVAVELCAGVEDARGARAVLEDGFDGGEVVPVFRFVAMRGEMEALRFRQGGLPMFSAEKYCIR